MSTPLVVDKTWSFRHNDERITYDQYLTIMKDHAQWTAEQERLADVEEELPAKRKKKK